MNLEQAQRLGEEIIEALTPACERIAIAGSVRRGNPYPQGLEIVYVPGMKEQRVDLFTVALQAATEDPIADLVERRFWRYDNTMYPSDPRHKRLLRIVDLPITERIHWPDPGQEEIAIDLFRAETGNWGYIYALHTGPEDFNQLWTSKQWHGGCCPADVTFQNGQVWQGGRHVPVREEEDLWQILKIPCWPPSERSATRLRQWMAGNKSIVD